MNPNTKQLARLMRLFEGYGQAYGTYKIDETVQVEEGQKRTGKATTLRQAVTVALWDEHLCGKGSGLGIIPINENNTVKFGAIDIDIYNLDHRSLIQKIEDMKMPLVVCRSKSGGAHCYVFMDDWCPAKLVQVKLREMASVLGYGTCEIYPKQTEIIVERGDMGQWINMPYHNAHKTTRYAFGAGGADLNINEFIEFAEERITSPSDLRKWSTRVSDELVEGPPCLNILCKQGFPNGTRNNGLFNLGVYAMKSNPDGWEKLLADLNLKYMQPPLDPSEVMGVIKSLKKKEYNYTCDQSPIQSFCNAAKCRSCKFGVGTGNGLPALGTLTKLNTTPPTWFIDIEGGGRLELTTEQLQNPRLFQLVCMEIMNMMPACPSPKDWIIMVQKLMETVSVVEVTDDTSPVGQFMEALERFCTGRAQAKEQEEILLGKPWLDKGRHYFRISDLITFLDRTRFKYDSLRWITKVLRDNKAEHKFFNIAGKGVNTWHIPEFKTGPEKFSTPVQEAPINPFGESES